MKIAIIGCGNMGKALAHRLAPSHQLYLYNRHLDKAKHLADAGYGQACAHIHEAIQHAEFIILAIKPQNMVEAAEMMSNELKESQTLVSLLAGTPIIRLGQFFPNCHIVRMMPNLAIIHGEGAIGLCADEYLKKGQKEILIAAFESLGKVFWVSESKIDALTALASSGPAFFFVIVEAMIDSGIAMGFSVKESQDLVYQMLRGSLALLENSPKHPGDLKWQVASPEGTTIAGLKRFEEEGVRGGIMNTFLDAYNRAKQLSG